MGLREKLLAENPYRAKRMPLFAAFCKSEAEGYEGGVNAALDAVREALLSGEAVQAASVAKPEGCWIEGVGRCGGTHADCYFEGVLAAALDVIDPKETGA